MNNKMCVKKHIFTAMDDFSSLNFVKNSTYILMQFLPTQKSPKNRSRSRLLVVEEDYSDKNRVVGRLKLKINSKISLNSAKEEDRRRKREKWKMGEKKSAPWFLKR